MADEKKTVRENKENGKFSKFVDFFKNLPQNIATPFKNMWHELKKVTWPTRPDLIKYTCIVILFMVFMGVVIGLLDMGSSRLVTAVSSLNKTDSAQVIIDDAAEEVTDAVEEAAEDAAEAAADAAQDAADAAEAAVTEAAEEVTEAAQDAAEQVTEAAQEAAEGDK